MTRQPSPNGHRPGPPAQTTDWTAAQYQPSGAPLLRCTCGAAFIDDEPSRAAHVAVFGHSPRPGGPSRTQASHPPTEGPTP